MRKGMGAAIVGSAAVGALLLAGCASSESSTNHSNTPTASPSASPSGSPSLFTKTIGGFTLTLISSNTLPPGWPSIPAPNQGTLQATGTATASGHAGSTEELLVAEYMAPGTIASVETAQKQQMRADGWYGGSFEHGSLVFEKDGHEAFIAVVDNASTDGVTVYQWAAKLTLPQASTSAHSS